MVDCIKIKTTKQSQMVGVLLIEGNTVHRRKRKMKEKHNNIEFASTDTLHFLSTPIFFISKYLYFLAVIFITFFIIVCLHRQPHCHTDGSSAQVIYYAQLYV